jgi:drug/metabolite transporter (DMT)-like permease
LTYFKLILVSLFWGGTFIATRIAAQTFEPFTGASLRYLIACALLVPIAWGMHRGLFRVDRQQFLRLCLLGASGIFAYNYFFFRGLKLVPASHGALLVALNPVMVMLFSAWRYGERIGGIRILGMLLALSGVVLVISRGNPAELFSSFEWGDAFMLGCPVTWAVYTLVGKDVLRRTTPIEATAWASMTGCVMLLLFAATEPYPAVVPGKVWIALSYLGVIGTVLAFVWYYEGVVKIGVTRTAVFNNLVPVFALMLSVVLLKEDVPVYTYTGAAMVVGGVVLTNRF